MRERPIQTPNDDAALKIRFGAVVRIFRQRLGISQEELAWRANIHRTYLADIERGRRNVSLSSIARLVGALGISLAEFFFAVEEHFQSPIEVAPPAKKAAAAGSPARETRKRAKARRRP